MSPRRGVVSGMALMMGLAAAFTAGAQGHADIGPAAPGEPLSWSFPVVVSHHGGPEGPAEPAVVADGAGALHAVWIDFRLGPAMPAVMYSRRDPAAAWGPVEVVRRAEAGVAVMDPQVAIDAMGRIHAVWAETRNADPDIYLSRRDAAGVWSGARRVNDDPGGAWQEDPTAVGDLWGSVHIVWTDYRHGSADIYHSRVGPRGRPGRNVRVNEPPGGDQTKPSLALTPGGDLHAVWQDTRAGRADVYSSMVPHAGLNPEVSDADIVWWPNARLNSDLPWSRQTDPAVVAGVGPQVRAVWVDADARLRTAVLIPAEPFWQPDTVLFDGQGARLSAPRLAVDPAGAVMVAWRATMAGEAGVWAAPLGPAGLGAPTRVDDTPITRGADALALTVGPLSIAHLLWVGPSRFGGAGVYHSAAQMALPEYRRVRQQGWLTYIRGRMNCAGDGYLLRSCDGTTGPFVILPPVPASFIGRWVEVEGALVEGTKCPVLRADSVVLAPAPCPNEEGAITGVVRLLGTPVKGAKVSAGDLTATTGASGRFFLEGLSAGRHDLILDTPCALEATLQGAAVQGGFTRVVADAAPVPGDVIADCRVDLLDLVRVTLQYKAPPPYRPACTDVNGDGRVAIGDVAIVAANYGAACPTGWRAGARSVTRSGAASVSAGPSGSPSPRHRTGARAPLPPGTMNRPGAGATMELRLAAATGFEAFDVTLSYGPEFSPADMDPVRPGTQPFQVPGADSSRLWVVANADDPGGGLLHLAAVGLAGARWPGPEATVAYLGGGGGAIGISSLELADATGGDVPGTAGVVAAPTPPGRLWLPLLRYGEVEGISLRRYGWPGRNR